MRARRLLAGAIGVTLTLAATAAVARHADHDAASGALRTQACTRRTTKPTLPDLRQTSGTGANEGT